MANKFKKGDQVIVITGSEKGKIGKVKIVDNTKVTIEGVNLAIIHKKPTSTTPGQIIKAEKPLHISNISHVEDGKAVKIRFSISQGEGKASNGKPFVKKFRVSKKSGKKIG